MNMFYNFDNLRHHYNSFYYFLNIVWFRLYLYSNIVSLYYVRLSWNLSDLCFCFIYHNLSQNLFLYLFLDKFFSLFYYLFDPFPKYLDLMLVMHFFSHFLYLINNCSHWHISICLDLNWNLFVMNEMFRSADFYNSSLLYYLRDSNRIKLLMIFMDNFIHIHKHFFWNLNRVLNLYYFLSDHLDLPEIINVSYGLRAWNLFNDFNLNLFFNNYLNNCRYIFCLL